MSFRLSALCLLAALSQSSYAQTPPPANLIKNGGFEASFRAENLWCGTDSSGYLTGQRGEVPILTESGRIADSAMPISVGVADMNHDGLLDIVSCDVLGYVRIYFNSGTPQQPVFTQAELADLFLSRIAPKEPSLNGAVWPDARRAARIFPTDIARSGKKDLFVGNYLGETMLVPNQGSAQQPLFKQPPDITQLSIPTTKESNRRWGNVFSPCTWDWDRDGRDDLLLGEGSYSANNIHLLLNKGAGSKPLFQEDNHFVLAYGDGLEQLNPTVVDYNGDGLPDLLVCERKGRIAVYLNDGQKAKPGEPPPELKFASFIGNSGNAQPLSLGGICTIATGDFNGDGLFDLLIGKSNGRISMLLNTGRKSEPKFGNPIDLKGVATLPLALPSGWKVDAGIIRGNFYGYVSAVDVTQDEKSLPPEGKFCLKFGYLPSPNKIMAPPMSYFGGFSGPDVVGKQYLFGPANLYTLSYNVPNRVKTNTTYTLSFKVKGNLTEGKVLFTWRGGKRLGEDKVTLGDRQSAKVLKNVAKEDRTESLTFSGAANWLEVRKDIRIVLNNPELKDLKDVTAEFDLAMRVPPGSAVYLDDFQLIEKL